MPNMQEPGCTVGDVPSLSPDRAISLRKQCPKNIHDVPAESDNCCGWLLRHDGPEDAKPSNLIPEAKPSSPEDAHV